MQSQECRHLGMAPFLSPFGQQDRHRLVDADERSGFMKKCAEAGVKGLKIDFFHTENLFTVNLMENILKDAAKAHLMVISME